jgi:methylmalonyl-CoA mutase
MNFFMEIAKMRAGRLLWAKLMAEEFKPKDPRSLALRTHCQTSGWSLAAQDVFNNVVRTCVEAMAATQGHTQSLHTNALDEALALPTDFSARIARNTQLMLQVESGTNRIIDPWGGSFYVERLTHDLAARALKHIEEVEKFGGMAKAIEAGIPKRMIGRRRRQQGRIDSGRQTIVRVNKYRQDNDADMPSSRSTIAPSAASGSTSSSGSKPSARRQRCSRLLTRFTNAPRRARQLLRRRRSCHQGQGDRRRISYALEGLWPPPCRGFSLTGVYKAEMGRMDGSLTRVKALIDSFQHEHGRRPRIWSPRWGTATIAGRVIASAFADLGFDVDIGPLLNA